MAGAFLKEFFTTESKKAPTVYLSNPTWANHNQIFTSLGLQVEKYPYWDNDTKSLNLKGFLSTIQEAPKNSIFVLHACAHNPTGLDATKEQWEEILEALAKNEHLALYDSAYQGFASGNLDNDGFAVRLAVDSKKEVENPNCYLSIFCKELWYVR